MIAKVQDGNINTRAGDDESDFEDDYDIFSFFYYYFILSLLLYYLGFDCTDMNKLLQHNLQMLVS
jgi:hypothetical protein